MILSKVVTVISNYEKKMVTAAESPGGFFIFFGGRKGWKRYLEVPGVGRKPIVFKVKISF